MKVYLSLYRWAMRMKLHMAMYTFVAIFLKILYNLLYGIESILISDLLSMWITCLLFAVLESVIFPEEASCTKKRSALWLMSANVFFVGGALIFKWFVPIPLWSTIILIVFLELGLSLMWFGDQFVLKMDSAQLTRELKQYQRRNKI